jgi:hypothetical protein
MRDDRLGLGWQLVLLNTLFRQLVTTLYKSLSHRLVSSITFPFLGFCNTVPHSASIACTHCLVMALVLSHAYTVAALQQACFQSPSLAVAVSHGFKIVYVRKHATTLSSEPIILSAPNTLQFSSVQTG